MEQTSADLDWIQFQQRARILTGIDLRAYKPEQMRRRLGTLLARNRTASFAAFARLLETDPTKVEEFRDFVTINVSEFYRDPGKWDQLRAGVLEPLLSQQRSLRVWSAGCSIGAEPYTIAMLLRELAPTGRHDILATDLDRTILARAARGDDYLAADVRNLSPDRLTRWFSRRGDAYAVSPQLRSLVRFQQHNLISDRFESDFDLILCRNVVIYFTEPVKDGLYQRFHRSLRPGGVLFVGATEVIHRAHSIGFDSDRPSFYRRVAREAA